MITLALKSLDSKNWIFLSMNKLFIIITLFFYSTTLSLANPSVQARTAILVDYHSGEILFELEPDAQIYPASMTKIMTAIVAIDLIKKNKLSLNDQFTISENAWRLSQAGYSSMFIMINDQVSVEDLLKGIIIASGNDACVALAEGIAGSEENFAQMMNEKAVEIGMMSSNFTNASGINDPDNISTVRDIALMSIHLIENYPDFYKIFKEKTFTWDRTGGDPIKQGNRNPLLYKNLGADGIKTGYLAVEKYSLASSINRNGRRLIAVGSGFNTKNARSKESSKLLTYGLTNYDLVKISNANESLHKVDVWLGKQNSVDVYTNQDIYKTIKKAKKKLLKVSVKYEGPIEAPIKKDEKIAILKVVYDDELVGKYDLLASKEVKKVNFVSRLLKSLNYLIWGDV